MYEILTLLLVAALGFTIGKFHERERVEQLLLEEQEDDRVLQSWDQPKLYVVHYDDVDAHFDELCQLGLVEQA